MGSNLTIFKKNENPTNKTSQKRKLEVEEEHSQAKRIKLENDEIERWRCLLKRQVDPEIPFCQKIVQAIHIKEDNLQETKRFIETHSQSTALSQQCLRICDELIESGVTLAIVGRLNSGKSMLVSQLLDWKTALPSADEATTGRITRFVYSKIPIIKKITKKEWRHCDKNTNKYDDNENDTEYVESNFSEDTGNENYSNNSPRLPQENEDNSTLSEESQCNDQYIDCCQFPQENDQISSLNTLCSNGDVFRLSAPLPKDEVISNTLSDQDCLVHRPPSTGGEDSISYDDESLNLSDNIQFSECFSYPQSSRGVEDSISHDDESLNFSDNIQFSECFSRGGEDSISYDDGSLNLRDNIQFSECFSRGGEDSISYDDESLNLTDNNQFSECFSYPQSSRGGEDSISHDDGSLSDDYTDCISCSLNTHSQEEFLFFDVRNCSDVSSPVVNVTEKDEERSSVKSEETLNENQFTDCIQLPEECRTNEELLASIIEIGIPSELLNSGLTIVDCPGLDENSLLSNVEMEILKDIEPSIICFVYDHRQGFSMNDGRELKELVANIIKKFNFFKDRPICEILLIANKFDNIDANEFDTDLSEQKLVTPFDQHEANVAIRRNSPWKQAMTDPFIDKDRMLPVLSLSTAKLSISPQSTDQENDNLMYRTMFIQLQNQIVSKIISHSRSFLSTVAYRILELNIDLYLLTNSLLVDEDLVQLIGRECHDDQNLLVDFTSGYKIYGLNYRGYQIHVTARPYSSRFQLQQELRKYNYRNCSFRYVESILVYTNKDKSIIYLIEKERSHKRLLDYLHEYSLELLIQYLKQMHDIIFQFKNVSIINFRPDNVYVCDNDESICVNLSIPNMENLPFILAHKLNTKPFHLHSKLKILGDCDDYNVVKIQNIYSFACLMWILIDGRGTENFDSSNFDVNKRIQLLRHGRFPNYRKELNILMKHCFKHHLDKGLTMLRRKLSNKYRTWDYLFELIFDNEIDNDFVESLTCKFYECYYDKCITLQEIICKLYDKLSKKIYDCENNRIYLKFLFYCVRYKLRDVEDDFKLIGIDFPDNDNIFFRLVDVEDPQLGSLRMSHSYGQINSRFRTDEFNNLEFSNLSEDIFKYEDLLSDVQSAEKELHLLGVRIRDLKLNLNHVIEKFRQLENGLWFGTTIDRFSIGDEFHEIKEQLKWIVSDDELKGCESFLF